MNNLFEIIESTDYEIKDIEGIIDTLNIKTFDKKLSIFNKILKIVLDRIEEKESEEEDQILVTWLLDKFFHTIGYLNSMILLEKTLTVFRNSDTDSEDVLNIVLEKLLNENETNLILPGDEMTEDKEDYLVCEMCGYVLVSVENIKYIMSVKDISPEEVLRINLESENPLKRFSFQRTAIRLELAVKQYYDETPELKGTFDEFLPLNVWKDLLTIAIKKQRPDAIRCIEKYLENLLPRAVKPDYIKSKVKRVPILPSNVEDVKTRAKEITLKTFQPSDISKLLPFASSIDTFMENLSIEEAKSLIKTQSGILKDDYDMIEGPENNIYFEGETRRCLGTPPYRTVDGCRMLTCICKAENDDYEDYEDTEIKMSWFKSKCENCKIIIPHASYCIRLPLNSGGWVGCFCSDECAINTANEEIKNNQYIPEYRRLNEIMATILLKGIIVVKDIYKYVDTGDRKQR
jgi:hypothetical protein